MSKSLMKVVLVGDAKAREAAYTMHITHKHLQRSDVLRLPVT